MHFFLPLQYKIMAFSLYVSPFYWNHQTVSQNIVEFLVSVDYRILFTCLLFSLFKLNIFSWIVLDWNVNTKGFFFIVFRFTGRKETWDSVSINLLGLWVYFVYRSFVRELLCFGVVERTFFIFFLDNWSESMHSFRHRLFDNFIRLGLKMGLAVFSEFGSSPLVDFWKGRWIGIFSQLSLERKRFSPWAREMGRFFVFWSDIRLSFAVENVRQWVGILPFLHLNSIDKLGLSNKCMIVAIKKI